MDVRLVIFTRNGQRRDFPLQKPQTLIGRAVECDLQIPLAIVSRRHCQITLSEKGALLQDVGSSNGTFYNGQRVITDETLKAGDRIRVGPINLTVVIDGQPENIEPTPIVLTAEDAEPGPSNASPAAAPAAPANSPVAETSPAPGAEASDTAPGDGMDDSTSAEAMRVLEAMQAKKAAGQSS